MSNRHRPLASLRRAPPLTLLTALLLAACGPSPTITVQLGDATVQVTLGSSASTEVTLTRAGGASADVTLDADGAPDWATVSFSPATLSGDTLTSTMTIETDGQDPDAAATSFTLTVTAAGSGLSASDELTVEVTLLTVSGKVTGIYGETLTGYSVSVNGGTPVPVDSLGVFQGPDVPVPYDLVVIDTTNAVGHRYEGLTTTDLVLTEPSSSSSYTTGLTGDLSQAVGTEQMGIVCMEGIDRVVTGCDTVTPGNTAFAIAPEWFETSTVSAFVHAWVVDVDADGATTGFAHEGRTAINLTDSVPAVADVALEGGPPATTVDLTVTAPPGVPLVGSQLYYRYSEHGAVAFPSGPTSSSYTAVMPDVPGATAVLVAQASAGEVQAIGWEVGEYGSGAMALTMPPVVAAVAPPDGATGVDHSTQFSVNNPSGSAVTFLFSQAGDISFYLVTKDDTVTTIPDLSALGLALPSGADFTWQAVTTPHLPTVDDVTREGWITGLVAVQMLINGGPGPSASGNVSVNSTRTFKTE